MKNRIKLILVFSTSMLTWSCSELPKKGSETLKKIAKTEKAEEKKAENLLLEHLKNTPPLNVEDLEAWIPKTLGGLSLERTKSIAIYKEAQMTGWYKRMEDKMITLSITDAAGPNGDMFASKINVFGTEPESDAGDIQMRSVNVKGRMARQDRSTEKNMTNILFFHKERFMIKISAFDYSAEETWNLVNELDFKALDTLIK